MAWRELPLRSMTWRAPEFSTALEVVTTWRAVTAKAVAVRVSFCSSPRNATAGGRSSGWGSEMGSPGLAEHVAIEEPAHVLTG